MLLDQWEKISSIMLSVISALAIVSGGTFTLIEYYDHKNNIKQSSSLALVSEYHSQDFIKYREKLDESWEIGYPVLIDILKSNTDKTKAYQEFVIALVKKEEITSEVNNIMNFYERIAICVNSGLCNKKIIDDFFIKNGRTFFRKYYPYVCLLRERWNDESIWKNIESYFNPGSLGKICR